MFKEWMLLREAAGDYVINCDWYYNDYRGYIASQLTHNDAIVISQALNINFNEMGEQDIPDSWFSPSHPVTIFIQDTKADGDDLYDDEDDNDDWDIGGIRHSQCWKKH